MRCVSPPETLGRLRQVRQLGVGGFASVWLYRDDDLDSFVAVKVLAENWVQQLDVRDRFLEEARILRRADSEHVVRVYDIGEDPSGTPYFVMAHADQGTVADLLLDGEVRVDLAVDLVEQAARGVAALHASGVVHRDLKPPNLLLSTNQQRERRLVVADLGLAKALMHASGLTQIAGSPAYMAPEQAEVGTGIDERADVHALGAVAYHLLTGEPLHRTTLAAAAMGRPPTPPSHLRPMAPAIDTVVLRAIAPDRAARWPDPMAFADALRDAASRPARPVPGVVVRAISSARHRMPARPLRSRGYWLLVGIVLAVGYAVGFWLF